MHITRIRLGYNWAYLVDGPGWRVLVDAGPDFAGAWDILQNACDARPPDLVVITHGHLDHAGLGARWQRAGVPVALGAADRHLAAGPQLRDDIEMEAFRQYVRASGTPPDIAAVVLAGLDERRRHASMAASECAYPAAGRGSRWPTGLRYEPFTPDVTITSSGPLTGTSLEVILCPGHTPGNLVLVEPNEGWLFSGDQLLPDITPTPAIQFVGEERFQSLPAFVAALERLQQLDLRRCFPGHGEAFDHPGALIAANLAQIAQRGHRVQALLDAGPQPVYELARRLYPRALDKRYWQIIATVQGQVDLLAERQAMGLSQRRPG